MLYELADTALIVESFRLDILAVALIREDYLYACVEESLLAETLQKHLIIVDCALEYLAVSLEHYGGTCFLGITDYFQLLVVMTALELLEVNVLAVLYSELQSFRKSVNNGSTNAVETA